MKRRYLTKTQKAALWRNQNRCCAGCTGILELAKAEFDHMHGLWCGGGNDTGKDNNWQALCRPCHAAKTKQESKDRGKVKRLEKQTLGIPKKRRHQRIESRPFGPSRGFDKSLRRKMSGQTEVRT